MMFLRLSLFAIALQYAARGETRAANHPGSEPSSISGARLTLPLSNGSQPQLAANLSQFSPEILTDYPRDPYQLRVPGTSTSLIFSKYGGPIYEGTLLSLVAKAQNEVVQWVVAAHGDGPVMRHVFWWVQGRTSLMIWRPFGQTDLTWLMLTDALEGVRLFFDELRGWFETNITILDDTAGLVGSGIIKYE